MLQFNKSQTTNSNAVWIDTVNTASDAYDSIGIVFSQSYDNSNTQIDATVVSSPTIYRNWLVLSNLGSTLPSPSGQYNVEIWRRQPGEESRWAFTDAVWNTTDQKWATFGDAGALIEKIYEDRAYVVGSNESSITQYVSPDEDGTYTTYNG